MLTLKNICWTLPDGEEILKGIDLTVQTGKLTIVTGPNGGGKTSLAKLVSGLEHPTSGEIWLDNVNITERAKLGVSYAFQQPVRFKGLTVRDLLKLSAGGELQEDRLCSILGKVGLCTQDYIDREVNASLSGGEIKRIEIATVLARKDRKLAIFDEPEAGIDLWSFAGLVDVFERLKRNGTETLLVISHQERLLNIADDIVVVANGKVRAAGPREEILPQLLADEKAGSCPIGKEIQGDE